MNKKKKTTLGVALLIAVLMLGVGYAAITNIDLKIGGSASSTTNDDNFKVIFSAAEVTDDTQIPDDATATATVDGTDATKATISVTGLTTKDQEVTFTYTIKNTSPELKASVAAPTVTKNTNSDYFEVTTNLAGAPVTLNPTVDASSTGNTTTVTVTVKMLKTPIEDQSTEIEVTLVASPVVGS